jgi:hypothetical protein
MDSPSLTIKEVYALSAHKETGTLDAYHVEKKYVDCAKQMKER